MNATETTTHWRREPGPGGITKLVFDRHDASANTLSKEVLTQLDEHIRALAEDKPRGVIVLSAKRSGFILGADVKEFTQISDPAVGARLAAEGQRVLARLAALPMPTVAAIDGYALGGGLELALACRYRVAVRGYDRNLGLPEVQLGIHPGFGGTVRLVQIIGATAALDLMLTGRSLSPVEAEKVGLVDRLAERDALEQAAVGLIDSAPAPRAANGVLDRLLRARFARTLLARRIGAQVARKADPRHYPAPGALLDLWVQHGGRGPKAYAAEADSLGRLLVTATSKNLVRVFLLRERMRNLAPKQKVGRRVHVVGAGVMGGDIAAWCALQGLVVSLQDRSLELVQPALGRARSLFAKRLKAPGAADEAAQRLQPDVDAARLEDVDVVIEAIVENADAKRGLYREVSARLRDDALLATNTSSIRLEALSDAVEHAERFIGLHFFNPVASMPLVEVIRGESSGDDAMERALAFVVQIGKLPLPCRSAPGFLVNRVLMPYMLEALEAHHDGYALETIDRAATDFGMPMGPIELADKVGLDVALHVARILSEPLGRAVPAALEQKVEAGDLGAKSGRGFYSYENDRPVKAKDFARPDADLQDRLLLPLLNEAVACLEEKVVDDADLIDAGVVFGTGFAPFTGGPLHYARARGVDEIVAKLEALAARHGNRFTPRQGWKAL